jgi:hypothetical protein
MSSTYSKRCAVGWQTVTAALAVPKGLPSPVTRSLNLDKVASAGLLKVQPWAPGEKDGVHAMGAFWFADLFANPNPNWATATVTVHASVPEKAGHVLVTCQLTSFQAIANGPDGVTLDTSAAVSITSYVKDGKLFTGDWRILDGDGITEVMFTLAVEAGNARAIGLIFSM